MTQLPDTLAPLLERADAETGPLVLLTGAGISAESGIPTFRGEEGYWTVGSRNYHPMELATFEAFQQLPDDVWSWYLYRRSVCHAAEPNAAHRAVAELEGTLGDGMVLATQNVDGLHLRAGSTLERTYQIHGNIDFMRCAAECTPRFQPIPEEVDVRWEKGRALGDVERRALECPRCGGRARPHVLWFDEYYDEEHFRFESSMRAAASARLLIVVGTAGQTNLPIQMGALVTRRGAPMIVVNMEESPFTEFAAMNPLGAFLQGRATELLPPLLEELGGRWG